jgi:hypothetical protein
MRQSAPCLIYYWFGSLFKSKHGWLCLYNERKSVQSSFLDGERYYLRTIREEPRPRQAHVGE